MSEILAPTICPECGGPIVEYTEEKSSITTHWCENEECAGRISDMLTFIADRTNLEIEGLGPEMALALAKGGFVVTLADLFEFCADAKRGYEKVGYDRFCSTIVARGLQGAATIKMIETAERSKTASWDRWIACLGIPMIGHHIGKTLAQELNLVSEDMANLATKFEIPDDKKIEGMGFHKRAEVAKYAADPRFRELTQRLYAVGVRPAPLKGAEVAAGAPLTGMVFCITGEMYGLGSREFITQQLTKLGATAKTGVSKKLTHLLVGTEPGHSKLAKAKDLKIAQYDEDWVEAQLIANGVKCGKADTAMEWAD